MDGLIAYILAKKIALSTASGISNITLNENQLIFQFKDGNSASMLIPLPKDGKDGEKGKDGISITNITLDKDGNLICSLSDNTKINAGKISNSSIVFVDDYSKLPNPGQINILYIADTNLFIWTGKEYKSLSSGGSGEGGSIEWGYF